MPRTSNFFLDCVFYIYDSQQAAMANKRVGGSGFLAAVRFEENPLQFEIYAVTAAHVLKGLLQNGGNPFLRMNMRCEQKIEVIETPATAWVKHPNADDIAVCPLRISTMRLKSLCVETDRFLTKVTIEDEDIGIGDEVFMVGRFAHHSGDETQNIPALRFGNIAMMDRQPIHREDGIIQESFLVECRSIPGYSGSPVFAYKRNFEEQPRVSPFQGYSKGWWLLGVDWCHLQDTGYVREKKAGKETTRKSFVEVSTGMAGVIPAWKILEVFSTEELVKQRQTKDKAISAE